jgi:hypothetical protein
MFFPKNIHKYSHIQSELYKFGLKPWKNGFFSVLNHIEPMIDNRNRLDRWIRWMLHENTKRKLIEHEDVHLGNFFGISPITLDENWMRSWSIEVSTRDENQENKIGWSNNLERKTMKDQHPSKSKAFEWARWHTRQFWDILRYFVFWADKYLG